MVGDDNSMSAPGAGARRPEGWPTTAAGGDDVVDHAFAVTREALSDATTAPTTARLAAYYDPARR
jgi:hypothetical protein